MTKEEAAIKAAMEAEEKAKESETSEDKNKEEDADEADDAESEKDKGEDDSLKTDYEAEIEKERSRREEAERKLAETRRKAKERFEAKKQRDEEESTEDEEDRPLTGSELRAILSEEREATRKEFQSQQILETAKELASSDAEARLIVEIHKNRSFPSGLSVREQIEESYAIANRKKLLAQNEELKRALRSKETVNRSGGGGFHDSSMKAEEPKIGSADISAIKAAGFEWDSTKRLYKKPIAGGKKYLYFNPKTKQRFVQ